MVEHNIIHNNSGTQQVASHNSTLDFSTFKKAIEDMVATNSSAYTSEWDYFRTARRKTKTYTLEEIAQIIDTGSLSEQRQLSASYFQHNGFYSRLIIYYATLLNYTGILIPNPAYGKQLSTDYIAKRYYNAVNFVDKMNLASFCINCATKAFTYGSYYGIIQSLDKNTFSVLDLPVQYCRSRFKDIKGNDIIEFDVTYFNTILDKTQKKNALSVYPKVVSNHYKKYVESKTISRWVMIPSDIGICFPLFEETPLFLNVIPATIEYDEAVDTERARDLEEIKKIIVQKIPHLTDGTLLFEPDEAEVMHKGSVDMMKNNKNVSVLTTYGDVEAIISKTASDAVSNNLEKMVNNIYYQSGTSGQLFAATGNLALDSSIKNDLSLVMVLAHKFENFVTNTINKLYSNSNISFKYMILPITRYNEKEYIENAFKLANGGYSLLLPALAMGFSQNDLSNLKDLENNVLNLTDKLIPLSTSYTQSGENEEGAPAKPIEEKAPKTLENQDTLDRGGSA